MVLCREQEDISQSFQSVLLAVFIEDVPYLSRLIKPYHPMHPNSPFYKGEEFFKKSQERDWLTGAFMLLEEKLLMM